MIKRAPVYTAQTTTGAYHQKNQNPQDDDDLPTNEETSTNHQPMIAPPSNLVKPKIHMANTAYEGFGGASTGVQSLAPSSTQMKATASYY
jgi:hypothetical protein